MDDRVAGRSRTEPIPGPDGGSAPNTAPRLLTIGELAELTGVPVRTIRFYSDTLVDGLPLVSPHTRSAGGYRLYRAEAAARLELIRSLRELGVDLPTVGRVLAREVTVAEVAHAHAEALEATVKMLRLRQAVLRALAVVDCDWEELELMHRLVKIDAQERRRILEEYLTRVFGGLGGDGGPEGEFAQMMRAAFPELPEDPSPAQAEAWIELVSLIQDDAFIARSREMAEHGARKARTMTPEEMRRGNELFTRIISVPAEKAYQDGIDPASAQGAETAAAIAAQWAEEHGKPAGRESRRELCEELDKMSDRQVYRFWHLVGQVGDRPALAGQGAPLFEPIEWLITALKTSLGD